MKETLTNRERKAWRPPTKPAAVKLPYTEAQLNEAAESYGADVDDFRCELTRWHADAELRREFRGSAKSFLAYTFRENAFRAALGRRR